MGLPIPIFVSVIPSNPNPMAMHFSCAKNRQIPVPILPLQDPLAKNKVPERNEFGKLLNLLMGCYRPAGTRALYKGVS
jgi:hypothetical protein